MVMEVEFKICPIWGQSTPANVCPIDDDGFKIVSPRAGGVYEISGTEWVTVKTFDDKRRKLLTSWLVAERQSGNNVPIVPDTSNFDSFFSRLKELTPQQRADNLLKYIKSCLKNISDLFSFETTRHRLAALDSADWRKYAQMLAWSESLSIEDLKYLLKDLENRNLLEESGHIGATNLVYSITMDGHEYLSHSIGAIQRDIPPSETSTSQKSGFDIPK